MTIKTLAEQMEDYDKERIAQIEKDEARRNTPEARAALEKKKAEEFERGVCLGWHDTEGNPIEEENGGEE